MGTWEAKSWGRVKHIFYSGYSAVSILEYRKGKTCSLHYHRFRDNLFYVLEGIIVVELWIPATGDKPPGLLLSSRQLVTPGEEFVVPARVNHRFRTLSDGKMIEVYSRSDRTPQRPVLLDDIVRHDEGGDDPEWESLAREYRHITG